MSSEYLAKATNQGVKQGNVVTTSLPTDEAKILERGYLGSTADTAYNSRFSVPGYWDDLKVVPGVFTFAGANDPATKAWQPGGSGATFTVYQFNTGDEIFFTHQLPHGYKQGTDLRPHVHWTPANRGTNEDGNTVAWKLDYSIANINGIFVASSTIAMTATCDGVDDKHQLQGADSGVIDGANLLISAVIQGRVYRDSGDTWSSNILGNRPVLIEFDIHFQRDARGSRQLFIK